MASSPIASSENAIDLGLTLTGDLDVGSDGDLVLVSGLAALQQNIIFRLKTQLVDARFCNYFLNTPASQWLIRAMATRAVSQANINPSSFRKNFEISLPGLEEQRYIADSLDECNRQTLNLSEAIHGLRNHKAALMQRLFPSLEELGTVTS